MAQTTINNLPLLPQQLIGEDFYTYVTTPTGGDFIAKLGEIVAQMQALNGCQCVQVAKLFIPAAEVLTLNTTPKPFGITVPAGYYAKALGADFMLSGGTTNYTGNTNLFVATTGATDEQLLRAQALEFDIDIINYMSPVVPTFSSSAFSIVDAADMIVSTQAGDPSTGDRDLTVWLTYTLIEL